MQWNYIFNIEKMQFLNMYLFQMDTGKLSAKTGYL